jgi:hypothetical protein
MNDRIIEMAIEAGFNPVNCTGSNVPLFNKFAELIVKECADLANEHNEEAEGVHLGVGRAIKEHFGVEE